MEALFWDGKSGYESSGNTTATILVKPAISCETIDYKDGAGTMTVAGETVPIDQATVAQVKAILANVALADSAPPDQCFGVGADGKYLGRVSVDQASTIVSQPLPSGQDWTHTNGQWTASVSLANCQSLASAQIDSAAGSARLRYVTDVPGQQAVYIEKLNQSQAWLANPTGTPPSYVQAEAKAMATDATSAANYIIQTAAAWNNQLSPAIEGTRRAGKIAVAAATTNDEVATVLKSYLGQLNAF